MAKNKNDIEYNICSSIVELNIIIKMYYRDVVRGETEGGFS